jgi:uncharacterized protein HemY
MRPIMKMMVKIQTIFLVVSIIVAVVVVIELSSLFIYVVSSTASGQLQSRQKPKQNRKKATQDKTNKKLRKSDQLRLFIF